MVMNLIRPTVLLSVREKGDRPHLCDDHCCASVPASGPFRQMGTVPFFLLIASMLVFAGVALADGDAPAKPAASAKPAPKPKPAARPAVKAAAPGPAVKLELPPPEDPAVATLLASDPRTPADWLRTARTLARLDRPDLAKTFLQKILAAKLDEAQWAALVDEVQAPVVTELATRPELLPEAEQLARIALAAVNRRRQDPERLATLIGQLQDASEETRVRAMAGLHEAHGAAVAALIAALADPRRAAEYPLVKAALVEMRREAIDPLWQVLDSAGSDLAVHVIEVLADVHATAATAYLLAPALSEGSDARVQAAARAALVRLSGKVPSQAEATRQLIEQALGYCRGALVLKTDADGRVPLWHWDAQSKRCAVESATIEAALRQIAARLAGDAWLLSPGDRQARLLGLTTALDRARWAIGRDKPFDVKADSAFGMAAAADSAALSDVLAYALAEGHPAAAQAAAEILGRIGTPAGFLRDSAQSAALVRAVRSPDSRVRIAALETIVRIQNGVPFAGSSRVLESLNFMAAACGTRRALLAGARMENFGQWVGTLAAAHFQVDFAATGRDAIRLAQSCPDYELAVVDPAIQGPPGEVLLQHLREDYRTATLRVALAARDGWLERAQHSQDPFCLAFSRPHSDEAVRWQMLQLGGLAPLDFVGAAERQEQARRARACLAALASAAKTLHLTPQVPQRESASTTMPVAPASATMKNPD
jgi:hypothetical protein